VETGCVHFDDVCLSNERYSLVGLVRSQRVSIISRKAYISMCSVDVVS
jgi:hypothetical protein